MTKATVRVPIEVTLRQQTFEKLSASVQDVPVADALSSQVQQFLENRADGALVLKPEHIAKIEEVTGKKIKNAQDVVTAALVPAGQDESGSIIKVHIDPTWMGPLAERAKEMGLTVDYLLSDLIQLGLESNWAYGLDASYKPPVYLPNYGIVEELTGKLRPTGAEVEQAIRELQRKARRGGKKEEPAEVTA
jgi:hypothetical protein